MCNRDVAIPGTHQRRCFRCKYPRFSPPPPPPPGPSWSCPQTRSSCYFCTAWSKSQLIPNTIGNRKIDCAWGCARGLKLTTWENLQIEKHKSGRHARSAHRTDLCFSICRFSQVVFILWEQPHALSLFLFPIVFGINLIHFFDEKKDDAAGNSIVCFSASILCHKARRRMGTVSKSATFLATESVNSAPFKRGETKVQVLGREKCKILRQ